MMADLLYLFMTSIFISLVSFGGGSQALFYQTMVLQKEFISITDLSAVLAFGYATPGPAVFGTAAFVGYQIAGLPGVIIGAVGIFAMPCLLAVAANRYISHWLEHPHARLFVQGVGLAAAGVVAATAFDVAVPHVTDLWHAIIALGSLVAMVYWKKLNPLWVLLAGGACGMVIG
jgi:chromate transporter